MPWHGPWGCARDCVVWPVGVRIRLPYVFVQRRGLVSAWHALPLGVISEDSVAGAKLQGHDQPRLTVDLEHVIGVAEVECNRTRPSQSGPQGAGRMFPAFRIIVPELSPMSDGGCSILSPWMSRRCTLPGALNPSIATDWQTQMSEWHDGGW